MKKILGILSFAVLGVSAAFAQDKKQSAIDDAILQKYFAEHKIKATKTASGLYYTVSQPGTGDKPHKGQQVTVNYTGQTTDGNKFDSNVDPAFGHVEPFSFSLGSHQVIGGWDEGIALLNPGSKAVLYLPSQLAYGTQSPSPKIPANSVMIFDVELVSIR